MAREVKAISALPEHSHWDEDRAYQCSLGILSNFLQAAARLASMKPQQRTELLNGILQQYQQHTNSFEPLRAKLAGDLSEEAAMAILDKLGYRHPLTHQLVTEAAEQRGGAGGEVTHCVSSNE